MIAAGVYCLYRVSHRPSEVSARCPGPGTRGCDPGGFSELPQPAERTARLVSDSPAPPRPGSAQTKVNNLTGGTEEKCTWNGSLIVRDTWWEGAEERDIISLSEPVLANGKSSPGFGR